ncbi:MAG: hypothetical protein GJV46_10355 [Geobacter sp.]|nr:hypothetical protein [Geobacter sp.]
MIKRISALLSGFATVWLLSACAIGNYAPPDTSAYHALRKNFDVTIGWNVAGNDRQTTIDGYVRNNRYHIMQDLELWITLLGTDGRERAQKSFFIIPSELPQDDVAGFSIDFGTGLRPGDKLRFFYRYKGVEDNEEASSWVNSFEAPLR